MAEVHTRYSPHRTTDSEALRVEADILQARKDYASMDFPENKHEYLGLVEELPVVLSEFQRVVEEQRQLHPDVKFSLEFHPSCVLHSTEPFMVFTFTLASKKMINTEDTRLYTVISWKFQRKDDYAAENATIKGFMKAFNVEAYDDGSGVVCQISNDDV